MNEGKDDEKSKAVNDLDIEQDKGYNGEDCT